MGVIHAIYNENYRLWEFSSIDITRITDCGSYPSEIYRELPIVRVFQARYNEDYRLWEFSRQDITKITDCGTIPGEI